MHIVMSVVERGLYNLYVYTSSLVSMHDASDA